MTQDNITDFIKNMPKVELHLHIEGSLEPELLFKLAEKNKINLKYKSVEDVRKAYSFHNLQSFLDIYYEGMSVLQTEEDFYELTYDYLKKIKSQNVIHTEIFFDPQAHTERGLKFETALNGIHEALKDGEKKLGISSYIIMCFLRHLNLSYAVETLEQALPYKDKIKGVGLDSSEVGNPPSKFKYVFDKAREEGFLTVAHAGEEGPTEYIWEAINDFKVKRIDHGVRALEDNSLVEYLKENKVPLTVCPLSNVKLAVFKDLKEHNLKTMLDKDIMVTINSDDPSYFGGYMNENFIETQKALNLSKEDIVKISKNSINATFLDESKKKDLHNKFDEYESTVAL